MNGKPLVSRYLRKQNYESLNYPSPSPQPFSPHHTPSVHQHLSPQKRNSLQQRQIEDLEQKVDIILRHNEQLTAENKQLKLRMDEESRQKDRMSRYQFEDGESLRRVRAELQVKVRECELLARDCESAREGGRREAEGLRLVIADLSASLEENKLETLRLQQEVGQMLEQSETEKRLALKQLQRRLQEDFAGKQREWAEDSVKIKAQNTRVVDQLCAKFEQERAEWNSRKNALVGKLQETHNREISELRQQMAEQFQIELTKLAEESSERCRNQRQKAERFIKQSLEGIDNAGQLQAQALRNQITALQASLQNRRKLIQQLTSSQLQRSSDRQGLAQTLLIRRRLKEQVQNLMRQNETLKIKTAEKHERDLKEMVRVYEDRIDVLTAQLQWHNEQNSRLRNNYQAEIQGKIKQRRAWEVEAGQLKNLVRKLKVELRGIEEQFKLNIDGIRDQNMTFSMGIMKSMILDRDKATFFQDQNRKLRTLYNRHQNQVQQQKKQANEKVQFYQAKYQHLKHSIQAQKNDLLEKQQLLDKKIEERQKAMKEANEAERAHLEQLLEEWQNEKQEIQRQIVQTRQRADEKQAQCKDAKEEVELLGSKLKQNGQHIQRLRMELEMAGVDDHEKQDMVNHWKEHYQGIILKLEGDKHQLKATIDIANAKTEQLVYKYKTLQNQLQKATLAIQRRGQLDQRVIQLGMDKNLVKNMAQIWQKTKQ